MDNEPPDSRSFPPVNYLPREIGFAGGFLRDDAIVFVRSEQSDMVLTNLPIAAVPDDLLAVCENIAEKALLAYVIASGRSVEYARLDYCVMGMQRLAREFGAKFLQPLEMPNCTQVVFAADIAAWYGWHDRYGWGRSIRNPPGTEHS